MLNLCYLNMIRCDDCVTYYMDAVHESLIDLRVLLMILDQKDENLEGQMTPLGGHLAPEGSSGGLRAKNVDFPTGFFFS